MAGRLDERGGPTARTKIVCAHDWLEVTVAVVVNVKSDWRIDETCDWIRSRGARPSVTEERS